MKNHHHRKWIAIIAGLAFAAPGLWGGCRRATLARKDRGVPSVIDIVPGRSIGDVRLGARVSDLPARATLNRPGGEMDGVRFVVDGEDRVEDVWIDDLRTFPTEIRLGDKVIPRGASLEDVQTILGGCAALAGIKGGLFFNCAAGVSIGTDFSKATLQIRVKPRTVG